MKKTLSFRHFSVLYAFLIAALMVTSCGDKTKAPEPYGTLPTQDQLDWFGMEYYSFIHFSINTFTDMEWGYGDEKPDRFNPTALDVKQWARVCKEAGMKGIILTAKHHDGFCLWPSAYTEHSVKNSPWKDGKGDLVREVSDACKEYGLKFGVYLSPWDRNYPEYGRDEYVTYYQNQIKELLTNYGDIFEVWFDGANGGDGYYGGANETRTIDADYYRWKETTDLVRSLQPNAIIFGSPFGSCRWVGNERGIGSETNWATIESDVKDYNRGEGVMNGGVFAATENDVSIRPGWFYHEHEDNKVKNLQQMVTIWNSSVGRNGTLLLNLPVDRRGLVHETDVKSLTDLREYLDKTYKRNILAFAQLSSNDTRGASPDFDAVKAIDNNTATYWATNNEQVSGVIEAAFSSPQTFNTFVVQEYMALGQRVKSFTIEALVNDEWIQIDAQTTIGNKRILSFDAVTATKFRFTVNDALACPTISEMGLYLAPEIISASEAVLGKLNDKNAWKITSSLKPEGDGSAIDNDIATIYVINSPAPCKFTVKMGKPVLAKGFYYLPRQDNKKDGIVLRYNFTADGVKLQNKEFSNIINNPILQQVYFDKPVELSSFVFDALASSGEGISIAEIGIIE